MIFPRPVTSVHQIELSSRCNLRCTYCPSKDLAKPLDLPMADGGGFGREKTDITEAHFARAIAHAQYHEQQGTQGELALTGIGEALLHPSFPDLADLARFALPDNRITLSTNGVLLAKQDELATTLLDSLAENRIAVYVSLHRPEKAKLAIDMLRERNLLAATNQAFATEAFDWAGALDWTVSIPEKSVTCEYLRSGWCVVLADGRVTTCCLDAEGGGVVGHVDDEPGSLYLKPWEGERQGCDGCHMQVPE
jgi:organic radical activating enzyme